MSAQVDYSKLCFAANIKGPGIETDKKTCDIERGVFSPLVPPGGTLQVDVPAGTDRDIEIIGFLRTNATDPCPAIPSRTWGGFPIDRVYALGSRSGVAISSAENSVTVTIFLPSDTNNIAVQKGLGSSCTSSGSAGGNAMLGRLRAAHTLNEVGTDFKISGRLNDLEESKILSGSDFKVRGRLKK